MSKFIKLGLILSLSIFHSFVQGTDTWVKSANKIKAQDIEMTSDGKIWMVMNNAIVQWDIDSSARGKFIWLANKNNKIIINKNDGTLRAVIDRKVVVLDPERLEFLTGIVEHIAIDKKDHLWAVTTNKSIYQHVDGVWERFPGKLSDIAIGANGQVWGLGSELVDLGYPVLKLVGNQWINTGGNSTPSRLVVDASGEAWIISSSLHKGTSNFEILQHKNDGWETKPTIERPKTIESDLNGDIWVGGYGVKYKRSPTFFKWNGTKWESNFHTHIENIFAIMPSGKPVFPGFYFVDSKVPRTTGESGISYTPDLGVINFTIDKDDVVWAIRDPKQFRDRMPEILTWDGNKFETAIETKKLWEVSDDQQASTDWVTDIAIDKNGLPWILAFFQLYERQGDGWKKLSERKLVDIISSPKGEIWAIQEAKYKPKSRHKKQIPTGESILKLENGALVQVGPDKLKIYKLAVDKTDTPWVLAPDTAHKSKALAVFRLENNVWTKVLVPEIYKITVNFANGVDGSLWLSAKQGSSRVLLKWDGENWKKVSDRFFVEKIGGDSQGKPMGIFRGGFVMFDSNQGSNTGSETKVVKKAIVSKKIKTKKVKPKKLPVQNKNMLVGCWKWSNGGYIVVDKNGIAKNGDIKGKWLSISNPNRRYSITWPPINDYITLINEGAGFSGVNTFGFPVSGTRVSGSAKELVGRWNWFTGIKVVISKNKKVKGGGFLGTWEKQEKGFVIEWPVIDQIKVSKNGKKLNVRNQFGRVTAVRDEACVAPDFRKTLQV